MSRAEALKLAEKEIARFKDGFYGDLAADEVYGNVWSMLIDQGCTNDIAQDAVEHFLAAFNI
jgi:hypothetical protein